MGYYYITPAQRWAIAIIKKYTGAKFNPQNQGDVGRFIGLHKAHYEAFKIAEREERANAKGKELVNKKVI